MQFILCYLLLMFPAFVYSVNHICDIREMEFGKVCFCSVEYCDYLDNPEPENDDDLIVVSSSMEGLRFATNHGKFNVSGTIVIHDYVNKSNDNLMYNESVSQTPNNFEPVSLVIDGQKGYVKLDITENLDVETPVVIKVRRDVKYQRISGFGGAFTGSVSYLLDNMDQRAQDHIYQSYFNESGIGYSMLRIPIGGSDFDLEPWAYNERPMNDIGLRNFTTLDPRDELKVDQLKRLKNITGVTNLRIYGAAWSPPPWMKSNREWTGYSQLLPEFYQTWADYHVKFLELMAAEDMPLWAISTGNEPLNGVFGWLFVHFMSLGWTADKQAIWLNDYLGPTLRTSKYRDVLIFSNDDQRYTFPAWFRKMRRTRPAALNYIDGLSVHWYWDSFVSPRLIDYTRRLMPGRILLSTESCVGDKPWQMHGPKLGSWERAEKYIKAFMQDLEHNFNGWIDWNLILNEQGGPNYVNNFVDAAIIVNTNRSEFYKQPMFYAIGHFSKFLPEGSSRIDVQVSKSSIDSIAFQRPDDSIVVIFYNKNSVSKDVLLEDSIRGPALFKVPANSIHSVVYY